MNYIFLLIFLFYHFVFLDILLFKNKEKINETDDNIAAVRKIILKDSGEGNPPTVPSIDI